MKSLSIVGFFTAMFVLPAFGQDDGNVVFSPAMAQPKARALMKEDFFWSTIDGAGPFGSDDGWEAAHGFYGWRKDNASTSPIVYLTDLIKTWDYPPIAWDEMDTGRLKAYLHLSAHMDEQTIERMVLLLKEQQARYSANSPNAKILTDEQLRQVAMNGAKDMGMTYLANLDEAIIGVAFAQIVMEDRLDPKLKYYVQKALQRELLAVVERNFGGPDQQKVRHEKMLKMLFVINHV